LDEGDHVQVTLDDLSTAGVYHLMSQVIVPRPIAWVVTDNGAGEGLARWNLAPYSYFNAVASDPPTVMFSIGVAEQGIGSRDGRKDTLTNLGEREEHTIALPNRAQLDAVEMTSTAVPHGESEFTLAGLDAVDWDWSVPRPSGARVAMGCTVHSIVPIADGPQRVVLARIHMMWIDDRAVGEDHRGRPLVDAVALDPLMRLGAGNYAEMGPTAKPARSARPEA
jgi:flavin reductase (DIM6/NTAB) family NADH-FMN oxidoreductase RutF